MEHKLSIYNSLSRRKEIFQPLNPPFVGLYVCGPTVYSDSHLGHARPAVTFDILYRYLKYLGYKVRYVRNITDVGHLEDEVAGEGEDRIGKKARLEQIEPMEVVQNYVNSFRANMKELNILPPSIEPQASGHIIEQQLLIEKILENGFAYQKNGSIYFDILKYNSKYHYGKLSGRVLDELIENTRELEGSKEKNCSYDFALWKKASPNHIMRWPSKWSDGFPGWHLECSAMSVKYLGEKFDIHGGGMDLMFPHHECEIAQNVAASGSESVQYWMHNNMITINGQKMARSLGNFITLNELFTGTHKLLTQAFSPMTIRFFILQAHYRSTLDFSNEALLAAEKGLKRLLKAYSQIDTLNTSDKSSVSISTIKEKCFDALNDDLNTPIALANLFEIVKIIGPLVEGIESITIQDRSDLKIFMKLIIEDILGLKADGSSDQKDDNQDKLIDLIINLRLEARKNKDFAASDLIRDQLAELGILIKDTKDGTTWERK